MFVMFFLRKDVLKSRIQIWKLNFYPSHGDRLIHCREFLQKKKKSKYKPKSAVIVKLIIVGNYMQCIICNINYYLEIILSNE